MCCPSHFAQLGSKKPDLLVRMIEVFMKHAPQTLQGMQNGLLEEDPVKIALNAHSLKSSSANLGARRLSELCKVVEFEAKTKAAAELALLVEKVHQEFELAVRTLQVKASLIGCRPGNVEAVGLPEKRAGAGARSY